MKKLFCYLMLLLTLSVNAQDYEVNWGEKLQRQGKLGLFNLIGIEDNHYYLILSPKRSNKLMKFDMNHKLVYETELNFKQNNKNISISSIIRTKNKRYGYMDFYDRGANKYRLFKTEFKNGEFGEMEEFFTFKYNKKVKVGIFPFFGVYTTNYNNMDGSGSFVLSSDSSKVGIAKALSSIDSGKQEELMVAVFDKNMDEVWSKKQKLPYKDKIIHIIQTTVSNNGDVYLLGYYEDKKQIKAGGYAYNYKVFIISEGNLEERKVNLGSNHSPVDCGIFFNDETNKYIVSGFYSDTKYRSELKGVFYFSGEKDNNEPEVLEKHLFNKTFLEGLSKKRKIKKGRGLDNKFIINNFLKFEDSSIGFIAEKRYSQTTSSTSRSGVSSTTTTYFSKELVITKFSEKGELLNLNKIEKESISADPKFTSYTLATYNGKICLLFNDTKERKERKNLPGRGNMKYTDLMILDNNGNVESRKALFYAKNNEMRLTNNSDYQNNKWLITKEYKKKFSFGIIDLK